MNRLLRFVGWAQILFGAIAACYAGFLLLSSNAGMLVGLGLVAAGLLSVLAGFVLLRARRLGWVGSVVLQVAQVPAFSLGRVMYELGLGAYFTLGVYLPTAGSAPGRFSALINFGLGLDFWIAVGSTQEEPYIAVNLVALALLLGLLRSRTRDARDM